MRLKRYIFFIWAALFLGTSCDLELQDSPNVVVPQGANTDFLLNNIQLGFVGMFNGASDVGMRLTRMLNQGANTYETAYLPQAFDGLWSTAYANVMNDIRALTPLAEAANLNRHLGIAKTIEAYILMTLVDYFGDVPYTEAFDAANFNPARDNAQAVYTAAFNLLNEADAQFARTGLGTPNDFFYGGNVAKWRRLINTLKLKYHLSRRLIDASGSTSAINQLISANNFITAADNFQFQYGRLLANPDSRHPRYAGNYVNGAGDYQSNFYMWHMTEAKGFDDPRARYYFYRQVLANPTDVNQIRCINEFIPNHYIGFVFCLPGTRGYWGRDHLDNQGIPPDGLLRTNWGVYPAGGRFDDNSAQATIGQDDGNLGAGIQPIMMASFVDFMLAEATLTLGTTGDPKQYLTTGIEKSMNAVRAYALSGVEASVITAFQSNVAFNEARTNYINYVGNEFDAAAGNANKMNVIGREYWLALFGNGVESYNLYRRTGSPRPMQPGLFAAFGDFPRSLLYPAVYVNTNNKAEQKASIKDRVFWDNNPQTGWVN